MPKLATLIIIINKYTHMATKGKIDVGLYMKLKHTIILLNKSYLVLKNSIINTTINLQV